MRVSFCLMIFYLRKLYDFFSVNIQKFIQHLKLTSNAMPAHKYYFIFASVFFR